MNSTVFSRETLNEGQARQIAEAYIKGDKDPPRIAQILQVDRFDLNLLMHPLVRGFIVEFQRNIRVNYTLHDHMEKLKEIRDGALDVDNFKIALSAETQIGKAAGLYDPKTPDDMMLDELDPAKLTTDQIRQRLAKSIGAVIPKPRPALEYDETLDDDDLDVNMV